MLMVMAACLPATAMRMHLEWNASYCTDVPYEVEVDKARLNLPDGVRFRILAETARGTNLLQTTVLSEAAERTVRLRFVVPGGTKRLACEACPGESEEVPSDTVDNLLADALCACAEKAWRVSGKAAVRLSPVAEGMLLEGTAPGHGLATFGATIPLEAAGRAVRLEMDLKSLSSLAWGNIIHVFQYDAAGRRLPEEVVEAYRISHARPPSTLVQIREDGLLHPKARSILIQFELRDTEPKYDAYGLPLADADSARAKLVVSRLALRPAETLPFPGWDDGFFGEGASGEEGDCSLRLGGGRAFFYNTHSQASWADGVQVRDEKDCFFPVGAGTVEAWIRPEWSTTATNAVRLFEASHHLSSFYPGRHQALGAMLAVDYASADGRLSIQMKDYKGHAFSGEAYMRFSEGRWIHLAVQWQPGGFAEAFADGRRILSFPLDGFEVADLSDRRNQWPNDMMPMEFFVGGGYQTVRQQKAENPLRPYLRGEVDLLRVTSGRRYGESFVPARRFAVDGETRALFTFDRTFDGVSGGGVGRIQSSVFAKESRVALRLKTDAGEIAYRPAVPSAENDSDKIFDPVNHKMLPTVSDFRASRRFVSESFVFAPGARHRMTCPASVKMDFVEIANTGKERLVHPIVLREGDVDPRSAGDLADSIGIGTGTARGKVDRLFSFLIGASDYFMNHTVRFDEDSDVAYGAESRPMTLLNSYCGFECSPLNRLTANFFLVVGGCPAGVTSGYGHVFEQVFFDGKNHLYDLTHRTFFTSWDNETPASIAECEREPGLLCRPAAVGCCDNYIRLGARRPYYLADPDYPAKIGVTLNPGETFRVWWANDGNMNDLQMSNRAEKDRRRVAPEDDYTEICGAKTSGNRVWRIDRFFPMYGSGFILRSGKPARDDVAFTVDDAGGRFTYRVSCPYPIVRGVYSARKVDGASAALDISTDGGKTFRSLPPDADGVSRPTYRVRGRHGYIVRVHAPIGEIADFSSETECMVNPRVFPGRLHPGVNELVCKATSGGEGRVTVGYRIDDGELYVRGGVFSGTLPGHERELVLVSGDKAGVFEVVGRTDKTIATASAGLKASLKGPVLTLSPLPGAVPRFECVTLADGERSRDVTVLVSTGARLSTPAAARVKGGRIASADGKVGVQDCAWLRKAGDEVTFACEPLRAGKYHIFVLERFGARSAGSSRPVASFMPQNGRASVQTCHSVNDGCDYLLAAYGMPGGRGNFKWDFPYKGGTCHPFREIHKTYISATDSMSIRLDEDVPDGLEIAAVLAVPDPAREFRVQMLKLLCGFNCDPWRVRGR